MSTRKRNKLSQGVGINDADYGVQPTVGGKREICPFYRTWASMLLRCYSEKFQTKQSTYVGCVVCDEWLTFSNFKHWMENQDWKEKELDKDLLVKGNKLYSPDTCVFVAAVVNVFTVDRSAARGLWPLGVSFEKDKCKFRAKCCNPFTRKREHLGYFDCPNQAHKAWKQRKHELALQLADIQDDPRVAKALRERYAPNTDWTNSKEKV